MVSMSINAGSDGFSSSSNVQQQFWPSSLAYIVSLLGFVFSLPLIIQFPILLYTHGGLAFLIPIAVFSLVLGWPLVLYEITFGHLQPRGILWFFDSTFKLFNGVAWALILVCFQIQSVHNGLLTCLIKGLFASTHPLNHTSLRNNLWLFGPLKPLDSAEFSLKIDFVPSLALAGVATFAMICRGPKSISLVSYATFTLPLLGLVAAFASALTDADSREGMKFLKPDFRVLARLQPWTDAAAFVFRILGIGTGVLVAYSGRLRPNRRVLATSVLLPAAALLGLLTSLVVFGTIGRSLLMEDDPFPTLFDLFLRQISTNRPKLTLALASLLAMTLNSTAAIAESVWAVLAGKFDSVRRNPTTSRILVIAAGIAATAPAITSHGHRWLMLMDKYTISPALYVINLLQLVCVIGYGDYAGWPLSGRRSKRWLVKLYGPILAGLLANSLIEIGRTSQYMSQNLRIAGWLWSALLVSPILLVPAFQLTEALSSRRGCRIYRVVDQRSGTLLFGRFVV